jgi:uncharacterized protein (TIGR02001 family)
MKHTRLWIVASIFAAGSLGLRAQTAPSQTAAETSALSWVITPAVVSQYMYRGTRISGPSFQPAIEFGTGGLVGGVWANFPIKDKVVGQSDPEYDFYVSYTSELIKDTLNWQPGATLYLYPNADPNNGSYRNSFEPSLALNYTITAVQITPKIYYDFMLKGPTCEVTAAYALPLTGAGTELGFTGSIGTFKWTDAFENSTPAAKNWGNYWLIGVSAPFQIHPRSKLTIGWAYTKGSGNFVKIGGTPKSENTAAVGRGVVTISCAIRL